MMEPHGEIRIRLLNSLENEACSGRAELDALQRIDASAAMCLWWSGYLKAYAEARAIVFRVVPWDVGYTDDDEEEEEAKPDA